MNFAGKTTIITGAANGIGAAIAELFARNGANIVVCDLNADGLDCLTQRLSVHGGGIMQYVLDVRDEEKVNQMANDVIRKFSKIDILVNNAGIWGHNTKPFWEMDSAGWGRTIDVNVFGVMNCTRAVINHMMENRYGRVINIASVAGVYGIRNMVDYSASKGAVIAFSVALAKEMGPYGVTVNAVSPGNISTRSETPELSFLERSGSPEECAEVVGFLASDAASFVSGQNWLVDGCRKKM